MPVTTSATFTSTLGNVDKRVELDESINCGDSRYYGALSIMAAKLSYENEAFIQNAVTNQWKALYFDRVQFCLLLHPSLRESKSNFCHLLDSANILFFASFSSVMAPGRPRRPYASEQPQSTSAANHKRVKGRAKNKYLTKHIKRGGGKPRIDILPGKARPIGDWGQEWINELGMIAKDDMPPFAHKWKDVDDDAITLLHEKVLNVSEKNKYSRSCLTTGHRGGSKSFIRALADMLCLCESGALGKGNVLAMRPLDLSPLRLGF
ncbi:hypothetical protein IFM89_002017 [Coptis chinensis]|uniref:Uncharacterized protein n=1 Tax=Coptis chinensis TaxID=261450 RepID=A0A835HKI8_9MAGN|nr:hypothetical protein IFM89_002017 [Coptis chinensis]